MTTMASTHYIWIVPFLLSITTCDIGVFGRVVNTQGFVSQSPKTAFESSGPTLRTDALRRWRRGVMETRRERCAELTAPWLGNTRSPEDNATALHLRFRPFSQGVSRGPLFPGKSLFSFVRRVYHCCQEGLNCRRVKGIQGRFRGDTDVEFLLTRDILSLTVARAEFHLQLSNPQHLDIWPVLLSRAKQNLPTRYSLWTQGNTVELRVDLLFLFQSLQEVAGGARGGPSLVNHPQRVVFSSGGDPLGKKLAPNALQDDGDVWADGVADTLRATELGLLLGCSQAGSGVSCRTGSVHLMHTPFMALYYR